jgi:hypothetical protein
MLQTFLFVDEPGLYSSLMRNWLMTSLEKCWRAIGADLSLYAPMSPSKAIALVVGYKSLQLTSLNPQ